MSLTDLCTAKYVAPTSRYAATPRPNTHPDLRPISLHPYIPTGGGGGGGGKDKDNMEKIQLDQGAVAYLLGRNGASAAPKT